MAEFSGRYTFSATDYKKIGIGALMAIGGSLVTYVASIYMNIDFGKYTYIIVPVLGILLNTARKWFTETKYK